MLLALRLRETMDESLQQEQQYRKVIQHNERLSSQIHDMTYQLLFIRDRHRVILRQMGPLSREVIGDDGESDDEEEEGEVLETFHAPVHAPPAPPPLAPTLV